MDKTCGTTGKRCFRSKQEARRAMGRLSGRLRIYRCPYCGDLHFTKLLQPQAIIIVKPSVHRPRKKKGRRILLTADGEIKYLE